MPFGQPPPAPPAEVRECGDRDNLFARLQRSASDKPALAFTCVDLLETEAQRDRILRDAFVAAIALDPGTAQRYLARVIDRPWVTDPGFFAISKFALSLPAADEPTTRKLLLKAAERFPSLALRELNNYAGLPFSREIFEQAARAAPDEAVGIADGASITAQRVLDGLRDSSAPEIQVLARLAEEASLDMPVRQRVAVFFRQIAGGKMSLARAVEAAAGPGYFTAVAKLRIEASDEDAALYDRVLENYAEVLFRGALDRGAAGLSGELRQLQARDLYLLLAYGRTEEDDAMFAAVFDRLLLPKLRATSPARLLDEVHDLNLRRFYASAAAHHRLDAFLATGGNQAAQAALLARSLRGIGTSRQPMDETLAAAEILDTVQDPARWRPLRDMLLSEYRGAPQSRALYGLLAASIVRKMSASEAAADPELVQTASRFQGYFKQPRMLDIQALFNTAGVCIQQYFFYDDDDAAESFQSFKQHYAKDRAWQWEDRGWYVHVTGTGAAGRRIEIFANIPHSILSSDSDDRRHAMTGMMAAQGLIPSVVVHRGHTWYVDESLHYLTPAARLVYLGSCRGLENAYSVLALANHAQMIATRGIGTHLINDPLLKAINDEILSGAKTLDWDRFWRAQESRLGGNPTFRDYIPPSRNPAAIMLAAYYDYLADGQAL